MSDVIRCYRRFWATICATGAVMFITATCFYAMDMKDNHYDTIARQMSGLAPRPFNPVSALYVKVGFLMAVTGLVGILIAPKTKKAP